MGTTPGGPQIVMPMAAMMQQPEQRDTSGAAIASLALGFLWLYWLGSLLAIPLGHVALAKIKASESAAARLRMENHRRLLRGEMPLPVRVVGGKGIAVAGLVLGYLGLAVLAALVLAVTM